MSPDRTITRPRKQPLPLAGVVLALALTAGCSGTGYDSVDRGRAREVLTAALDGWKKGETPETLKGGSPSIVAQDLDWIGGAKLVGYQIDGEGKQVEGNLYVPVTLTLRGTKGKEVKKNVS